MTLRLAAVLAALATAVLGASATEAEAAAFRAIYRESASRFQVLDCVAEWWDHCQDGGEYRKEWIRRFGPLSSEDLSLLERYGKLRESYLVSSGEPEDPTLRRDGFFARGTAAQEDPLQFAFFSARNEEEAFARAGEMLTAEELRWLRSFYSHFEARMVPILEESRAPFAAWARRLNGELARPGLQAFMEKIAGFYGVEGNFEYGLIITWWPPLRHDSATPVDTLLVFQKNPLLHMEESDLEVVFHEVVHTISARQPKAQKQELTRKFLEICAIKNRVKRYQILEEPLAVALGQIAYLEEFDPENLRLDASLYRNPWISAYGKAVHPLVRSEIRDGRSIKDGFIEKAARQCQELVLASDLLQAPTD